MDKKLTQLLLLCESLTLSKKKPVLRERERERSFHSTRDDSYTYYTHNQDRSDPAVMVVVWWLCVVFCKETF
jgi:hypothetical protein